MIGIRTGQFEPPISAPGHFEYLKYYDQFDIALDSFPYSGGTTTMEAIWQGVPVLASVGDRWAARTSRTLLNRTHLRDYVAPSPGAMVQRAIELANSKATPSLLERSRAQMRERLMQEQVMNGRSLARHLERIYHTLCAR